jgi:hypothetical protein
MIQYELPVEQSRLHTRIHKLLGKNFLQHYRLLRYFESAAIPRLLFE